MKATAILLLLAACGTTDQQPERPLRQGLPKPMKNGFVGLVYDERQDAIDFSTGVPVHTHRGEAINLSDACPDVYKYAYLESVDAPLYGSETTPNPFAWQLASDVPSPVTASYRVRSDAREGKRVLLDWVDMIGDGGDSFTVDLRRDGAHGFAELGTETGRMYLDVKLVDVSGAETMHTACWNNHPLAAPIIVGHPTAGSLFDMTFAAHSPISEMLNTGAGVDVLDVIVIQPTAEAVPFQIAAAQPSGTATKDVVDTYIAVADHIEEADCGSYPCTEIADSTRTEAQLPIAGTWQLRIEDLETHVITEGAAPMSLSSSLPPRAANAPAKMFRVTLSLSAETSVAPDTNVVFSDQLVGDHWFTGEVVNPGEYIRACSKTVKIGAYYKCEVFTDYQHVKVANQATIAFDAITLGVADGQRGHRDPDTLIFAAQTWNPGDAGF